MNVRDLTELVKAALEVIAETNDTGLEDVELWTSWDAMRPQARRTHRARAARNAGEAHVYVRLAAQPDTTFVLSIDTLERHR